MAYLNVFPAAQDRSIHVLAPCELRQKPRRGANTAPAWPLTLSSVTWQQLHTATEQHLVAERLVLGILELDRNPRIAARAALDRLLGEAETSAGSDDHDVPNHVCLMRTTDRIVVVAEDETRLDAARKTEVTIEVD